MKPPADIWRRRLWLWLPAALFFLVNAAAFTVYRFGYADRVAVLKENLKSQAAEEKAEEAKRRQQEGLLQQATINRQRIEQLYAESFSTRRRRLTGVTAEVISLAGKAGLAPRALAYPEQEIQGYNLVKRSFVFAVDGTYLDLRKFINLLELSDSFLTLEAVSLSETGGRRGGPETLPAAQAARPAAAGAGGAGASSELHISLRLATFFEKDDTVSAVPATPADAARGGRSRE